MMQNPARGGKSAPLPGFQSINKMEIIQMKKNTTYKISYNKPFKGGTDYKVGNIKSFSK